MDWVDFLRIMRFDEMAAQGKYRAAAKLASDPRVKEVLERLAYEEEIHVGVLQKEEDRLQSLQTA